MYVNTTTDAASPTTRFRMFALCTQGTGATVAGARTVAPIAFKGIVSGFRAWSPPV